MNCPVFPPGASSGVDGHRRDGTRLRSTAWLSGVLGTISGDENRGNLNGALKKAIFQKIGFFFEMNRDLHFLHQCVTFTPYSPWIVGCCASSQKLTSALQKLSIDGFCMRSLGRFCKTLLVMAFYWSVGCLNNSHHASKRGNRHRGASEQVRNPIE